MAIRSPNSSEWTKGPPYRNKLPNRPLTSFHSNVTQSSRTVASSFWPRVKHNATQAPSYQVKFRIYTLRHMYMSQAVTQTVSRDWRQGHAHAWTRSLRYMRSVFSVKGSIHLRPLISWWANIPVLDDTYLRQILKHGLSRISLFDQANRERVRTQDQVPAHRQRRRIRRWFNTCTQRSWH